MPTLDQPDPATTARADSFLADLAAALHRYGLPSYRVESSLHRVAKVLNVPLNVFSVPTGITLGFGPPERQRVRVLRVEPGAVNLSRVALLSELIEDIAGGSADLIEAEARLASLPTARLPHGWISLTIAWSLASGSGAILLSGGIAEAAAAAAIGLLIGLVSLAASRSDRIARLFELGGSAVAAFLAASLASSQLAPSREIAALAAIIILLPGYTFTVALNELATNHLASGTARLGGAFTTMLVLACGSAIGFTAADALGADATASAVAALPPFALYAALFVAPLAFKVIFQARHRDTHLIVLAAFVAYLGARLGAWTLGADFGAAAGAFALGLFSNLLARVRRLPAAITLVPGLLVLVPGALSFRAFAPLLDPQSAGLDRGLDVGLVTQMLAVGISLVGGLIVANVVLPSRRSL